MLFFHYAVKDSIIRDVRFDSEVRRLADSDNIQTVAEKLVFIVHNMAAPVMGESRTVIGQRDSTMCKLVGCYDGNQYLNWGKAELLVDGALVFTLTHARGGDYPYDLKFDSQDKLIAFMYNHREWEDILTKAAQQERDSFRKACNAFLSETDQEDEP